MKELLLSSLIKLIETLVKLAITTTSNISHMITLFSVIDQE